MKTRTFYLSLILAVTIVACEKVKSDVIVIDGYVRDKTTNVGLKDMNVYVSLIRSESGKGGGRVDHEGVVSTDKDGHFTVSVELFRGAETFRFIIAPKNSDSSKEIRLPLSEVTPANMPLTLQY
jgi:hypothetical protein